MADYTLTPIEDEKQGYSLTPVEDNAAPPQPFLDRLYRGSALASIKAAASGAKEAFGPEPLGMSPEHVRQLQELGIYRDPATGRGGALRLFNESVMQPAAVLGDALMRGGQAVIGGISSAIGQTVEGAPVNLGSGERAKEEVANFLNYAALRGDMQFGRVDHGPDGPHDQPVGVMPRDQDFKSGAQALTEAQKQVVSAHKEAAKVAAGGPPPDMERRATLGKIADIAEQNLRDLWEQRGIHPAEAVYDAQNDNLLKQDLTTKPYNLTDHSDVTPIQNSPVAVGTPRSELGRTGNPLIDRILESDVTRNVIDNPVVDRRHTVPYTAGGSVPLEDPTIFIDRRFPRSFTIDGVTFDPTDPFIIHENIEQHTMEALIKGGMDEGTAYKVAHFEFAEKAEGAWYRAHGIDQEKAEAAYAPFMAQIQHEGASDVPSNLYKRPYPHDNPSAALREPIAEPKPTKAEIARAHEILGQAEEPEMPLRAVGADVAPPMTPLAQQPPHTPGRLMAAMHDSLQKLFDMGRDLQMLTAPMATGTNASMAIAKDFANATRRNRWEWSRIDDDIAKRFTREQRQRMWDAADEESVARQLGESLEHQGLVTLEPTERAAVLDLQARAQMAWVRARDLDMVEGEGLPAYTPRMILNVANGSAKDGALSLNAIGRNLKIRTAQMLHRGHITAEETEAAAKVKYGEQAELARDIRVLPLATAKLEDAIAGRTLINNIKEYGKHTGDDTVAEGSIPAGSPHKWFTMQENPAFMTWRPKMVEAETAAQREQIGAAGVDVPHTMVPARDTEGNMIFEKVPIYVRGDFEGPLRAVLTQRSGPVYGALMGLKGKTMSLIMNSPMIHNAVEWGRALPAMPGKVATFKVYFEGNRVKNDPAQMREAIDSGLVPIGHRFFNQDISSIMEEPNLTPGRSWTAKIIGAVPGLFDPAAGNAVKTAIDKAGDFWHNTLLWDRIADLQAGLYANFRDDLLAKGVDRRTATIAAAHWANRFAGSLPREAMSDNARKVSNFLMFSRTFTLGNLGIMKDIVTGLPKDALAQIERDAGVVDPAATGYAKSLARRKAMMVVMTDIGLMYVGNSMLQSVMNVMRGDNTLDQEMHGYAERFSNMLTKTKEHPLSLLQPLNLLESLSSTASNEPGKQDRIKIGQAKDGTAIYARNPAGKIGDEFVGYLTGPLDMIRRKMGTIVRPAWQIMSNDAGFGRKVYDPDADTPAKYIANLGRIAEHLAASQFPESQFNAFSDLVHGHGDQKVNEMQAFGPVAGVTFSKGAPGGPAVGELYHAKAMHDYAVQSALPDIRRQIQDGDIAGATAAMRQLGIPPGLQKFYLRTTTNPATRLSPTALKQFYEYATPEQIDRLESAR